MDTRSSELEVEGLENGAFVLVLKVALELIVEELESDVFELALVLAA